LLRIFSFAAVTNQKAAANEKWTAVQVRIDRSSAGGVGDMTQVQINQRDLEYLLAIQQFGSFVEAADRSNVTQPALSNHVRRLEDRYGLEIFERRHDGVITTECGALILSKAREVLFEMKWMSDLIQSCQDPLSRSLRIGYSPTLAIAVGVDVVQALQRDLGNVRIELTEGFSQHLVSQLNDRRLDLALVSNASVGGVVPAMPLFSERLLLAVPSSHVLARRLLIDAVEVPIEELILVEPGDCLREQVIELCGTALIGAALAMDLRSVSLDTALRYVNAGLGCTLVPEMKVGAEKSVFSNTAFIAIDTADYARTIVLARRNNCPRVSLFPKIARSIKEALSYQNVQFI